MLTSNELRDELREFCDADYSAFAGFPATKAAARARWAAAFDTYISSIDDKYPKPPGPSSHLTLSLAMVKGTFEATLKLEPIAVAATAAADFADAWQAAVNDVKPQAPVTDTSGTSWVFVSWIGVPALRSTLASTLTALFEAPSTNTVARLGEISDAFHAATKGLVASVTTVTSAGSPGPLTMTVG